MKTKKFSKKLVLNKKTITDLKTDKMREAYGGYRYPVPATPPLYCTATCTCIITGDPCPDC